MRRASFLVLLRLKQASVTKRLVVGIPSLVTKSRRECFPYTTEVSGTSLKKLYWPRSLSPPGGGCPNFLRTSETGVVSVQTSLHIAQSSDTQVHLALLSASLAAYEGLAITMSFCASTPRAPMYCLKSFCRPSSRRCLFLGFKKGTGRVFA